MSSNSKKGAKRKRSTQVSSARIAEGPLCANFRGRGNKRFVNAATHDTAFCAHKGGNYEVNFAEARKAAKAAKEAAQARKFRSVGQPADLERKKGK